METTQLEHPLQQTFARVTRFNQYVKPQFGEPQAAGWLAPTVLLVPASVEFATMVSLTQKRLHTQSTNMIAGALIQAYQWPLIAAAIGCYLVERRVPDLAIEQVQLLLNAEGAAELITFVGGHFAVLPDDPAATHPDAVIVPDQAALRDYLRAGLETHLGLVIDQLSKQLDCGKRGLWLFVADRCVSTLSWLMQEQDKNSGYARIDQEVSALIRVPGSPLNNKKVGLFELTYKDYTEVHLERATCCYWYKTDGGEYCTTCPHRAKEDRNHLLLGYMAEEYAQRISAN